MGLLNCTWPHGGRPADSINYADGAWTGVEYQVAAHMVWQGLVVHGLTIAKGARERYDGERRNPFDEPECGHHYARPLSSWSLLQALTGVQVDGPAGLLSLRRLPPRPSRWLLIGPEGWGTLAVDRDAQPTWVELRIECLGGRMSWRSLRLGLPGAEGTGLCRASGLGPEGQDLPARCEATADTIRVDFEEPAAIEAGGEMRLLIHGDDRPAITPGARETDISRGPSAPQGKVTR